MIQELKNSLETNGYFTADVSMLFPQFDLDAWLSALNDSWLNDKNTSWAYQHMIFGSDEYPAEINIDDLPDRRKLVEEEVLVVDQQFWQLKVEPNMIVGELGEYIHTDLLPQLFPVEEGIDYHLDKKVCGLATGDFITPQSYSDKLCHIMLCVSDIDLANTENGEILVGTNKIPPKKGTFVLVDPKSNLSMGVNKVDDNQPRFVFRAVVNTYIV